MTAALRVASLLVFIAGSLGMVALTVLLAFCGYILFLCGFTASATFVWGVACLPLVLVGVAGSFLYPHLRHRQAIGGPL
jgi:hypothetical protein